MNNTVTYALGINYLDGNAQNMKPKEIYWLNTKKTDIKNFINQVMLFNNDCKLNVNIDSKVHNYYQNKVDNAYEDNRINLFNRRKFSNTLNLKEYIKQLKMHKNSLVVFFIPNEYLTASLGVFLKNIKLACIKYNCSVLFISDSNSTHQLKDLLVNKFKLLSGFSLLTHPPQGYILDICYWFSVNTILSNEQLALTLRDNKLMLDNKTENTINYRNDSNIYYIHEKVMANKILHSDNWISIKSNKEIINIAEHSYSATLVLSINEIGDIDELAEKIHHIRSIRGKHLKLVVAEVTPCIRSSDERLLLTCGANLVIRYGTTLTQFLSLLESIQNQTYSKALLNDIHPVIEGMKALRIKGFVSPDNFMDSINILLGNEFLPEDARGLLFIFTTVNGLPAKQALPLCKIRRHGDILTILDNNIYLFLSSCRLVDEQKALSNIFQLPIEHIFKNKQVFNRDKDIRKHVTAFRNSQLIQNVIENANTEIQDIPANLVSKKQPYTPKPVTLKFS